VKESERRGLPCGACGKPIGTATIVAGGDYPDVRLCAKCFHLDEEEMVTMIKARLGGVR